MDAVAGGTVPGGTMGEAYQAAMHSRNSSLLSTTHSPLQQFSVLPEATLGVEGHGELLKERTYPLCPELKVLLPAPA